MTCSRNVFKHLQKFYQTKTNREMFKHDFQFFASLVIFSQKKKMIKYSLFIFKFHICANQKKKNWPWLALECFHSHRQNLKELHEFLHMMNAITNFKKISFIYIFVNYGLVTKSFGVGAHLRRWQRKQNVKKWMWIFYNQIRMNCLT